MDIWMVLAVLCAYFVKGMCGFANTLVFSTILSFRESNLNISPVELLTGYPSNVLIAFRERKSLSLRICLPLSAMVVAGSVPGAFLLKNGDVGWVKILFGFAVAGIGAELYVREQKGTEKKGKSSPVALGILGLLSGLLCGLFGIGALLAAYVGRTTQDNSAFRGNLCIVFLVENTFRVLLYARLGILTWEICKTSLCLMPFMLAGLGAGIFFTGKCSERSVRRAVVWLLMASGVFLVWSNMSFLFQ